VLAGLGGAVGCQRRLLDVPAGAHVVEVDLGVPQDAGEVRLAAGGDPTP
jgi:hypothetical protein